MIRWLLLFPVFVFGGLLARVLAPLALWLRPDGVVGLRSPFRWIQPFDHALSGLPQPDDPALREPGVQYVDAMWWRWICTTTPKNALSENPYEDRPGWVFWLKDKGYTKLEDWPIRCAQLIRNGGATLNYTLLGAPVNAEWAFYGVRDVRVLRWSIELRWGWKTNYPVHGRYKYTTSLRVRSER